MNGIYSLDKLVVWMRIRSAALDPLIHCFRFGSGAQYGELLKDWIGMRIMDFHYQFVLGVGEESWYLGVQPNKDAPNEHWTTCKIEFNPNKVANIRQFVEFYDYLIANCKHLEFKRFDVAIDLPVPYVNVHMFKDRRMVTTFEYSAENKTVYMGARGAHGRVKLYNKQLESKLDKPLTRLEITMHYEKSHWQHFKMAFPRVYVYEKLPDSFQGVDLVLGMAISEHSEYMGLIGRRKREKIMRLLDADALGLKPCEIQYKGILQEIMTYGKHIPVEKFTELEDSEEIVFQNTEFDELTGEQCEI